VCPISVPYSKRPIKFQLKSASETKEALVAELQKECSGLKEQGQTSFKLFEHYALASKLEPIL
jgi:hypothetical protein